MIKKKKTLKKKTSVKKDSKVSKSVYNSIDEYWEHFFRTKEISLDDIGGKYLFFSPDREVLRQIAINEIENCDFQIAKVSATARNNDFVLCLYYKDDSRKKELFTRYGKDSKVKYRHWKSDFDTAVGNYSQQYMDSLPADQKEDILSRKELYNPDRQAEINNILGKILVRKLTVSKIQPCPDDQLSEKQKAIINLLQEKNYSESKWIMINNKQMLLVVSSDNSPMIVDFAKPNEIGMNQTHFPVFKIPKGMENSFAYWNKQIEDTFIECWMNSLSPTPRRQTKK